ncbi:MAG: VOC family protein [Gammaproteobacteria bacterium]|nr:VOC family protein [Gammaproteobacteria bacterium]
MQNAKLEHINMTVSDPRKTAALLCELFDWKVRWSGESTIGGFTVHVGRDDAYLALYSPERTRSARDNSYVTRGGMNHVGVVVDDLDEAERRVIAAGFEPNNHGDYEPGRRFYFDGHDGIEFEVVSYA